MSILSAEQVAQHEARFKRGYDSAFKNASTVELAKAYAQLGIQVSALDNVVAKKSQPSEVEIIAEYLREKAKTEAREQYQGADEDDIVFIP